MNKFKLYFKTILIPLLVGGCVSLLISKTIDYNMLNKPVLSPPGILFPIMWTILYVLMGVSYGILKDKNLNSSKIKGIYYFQLIVNGLWSIIFFNLKWRLFAFLWIVLLDVSVIVMIYRFYKESKVSALLQLPYLFWCLFASYLNLCIYLLN